MSTHHDPDQLRAVAVASARGHGCTCTPDVTITEEADGLWRASVHHAGRCPVLFAANARWN